MSRFRQVVFAALLLSLILLSACQHLVIDTDKIVRSDTDLPEIVGIIAGFGTTFAAFPDFLAMIRRRSSEGMSPRMGAIMGAFQILWVYYGLLIASRPLWVCRNLAMDGRRRLYHRFRFQVAVALRMRGARQFLFHQSHYDWERSSPTLERHNGWTYS